MAFFIFEVYDGPEFSTLTKNPQPLHLYKVSVVHKDRGGDSHQLGDGEGEGVGFYREDSNLKHKQDGGSHQVLPAERIPMPSRASSSTVNQKIRRDRSKAKSPR